MKRHLNNSKQTEKPGEVNYNCTKCKDTGWLLYNDEKGNSLGKECQCREQQKLENRFKSAMIPSEFKDARFNNYKQETELQKQLYESIGSYLQGFKKAFSNEENTYTGEHPNLGFIAEFGEQRIRQLESSVRSQVKKEKNSFGLGKTHLQIAAAKWLLNNGFTAVTVSDTSFMDELMQARMLSDESETFNRLLNKALTVNVLIWTISQIKADRSQRKHVLQNYK